MPNEKTELENFLDGINKDEGKTEDLFNLTDEVHADKATAEEKEEEPKKLPFNKDEKLQKYIDKQVEKRLASHKPEPQIAPSKSEDEDPLDDVLIQLIGNDTSEKVSIIKNFKNALASRDEKVKQSALNEINARVEQDKQAEIDAQAEVSNALDEIEETFDIDITSSTPQAKKLRSEFLDFVGRVASKDKTGNITSYPDFIETYKVYKDANKPVSNDRAKELANRSISPSNETTSVKKGGNTFEDFERMIENLSN